MTRQSWTTGWSVARTTGRGGTGAEHLDDLWAGVAAGNRRALARAITVLEAGDVAQNPNP